MDNEFQGPDAPRDLLGDPVDLRNDRIGRPGFEKTKEKQDTVLALRAAGWTQERIARRIGCDPKTLRNLFSRELDEAADIVEAEALGQLYQRMRAGNVSAARQFATMASTSGKAAIPSRPDAAAAVEDEADAADPAPKLGKKERLAQAAQTPGRGWGSLLN